MKRLRPVRLAVSALHGLTLLALTLASFLTWSPLARAASPATSAPAAGVKPAAAPSLTVLEGSLTPLVEQFNKDSDRPRVLALLSPT